jgi:hypothetical protein
MSSFIKGQHFFSKTDLSHFFNPEMISCLDGITIYDLLLRSHVCRTWNRTSKTNYNFCRQQDGTLSLKMAEFIENILWTTTECMLPKRKPKFVVCIICASIYLPYMKWYSLSLSMGCSETSNSSLSSPTSPHKFPVNYHLLTIMYGNKKI